MYPQIIALGWVCLFLMEASTAWANPADRLKRIQASKVLRVCIWPDYYGISFRHPKTQQLTGIDIDNAHALAQDLGAEVTFIDSSFAKLVDDVTTDKCDIAMFAVGITPQRQDKLRFTQPHLVSDIYAITTQSNPRIQQWADLDTPGTVLVVTKGTLHEPVMKAKLKAAELRVVDAPAGREQAVQSGQADALMTDFPFSRRMLDQNDWARLVSPPDTYHLTSYAWAMQPGDDAFHARVNRVLTSMKRDGRLLAHARKHGLEPIVAR